MVASDEYLGKKYTLNELYKIGVREGDIVARPSNRFNTGTSWNYYLLRKGISDGEFNTSLCCYKDSRLPEKTYLSQIGFNWVGGPINDFRLITKKEYNDFVDACVWTLKTPIVKESPTDWGENEYAQIIGAMAKYKLLDYFELAKLNNELIKLHGTNFLSLYKKLYYC